MLVKSGQLVAHYRLIAPVGQGGMGVVYKAHHLLLKSSHAIKVILPELVGNDSSVATRFRQEAMAAAAGYMLRVQTIKEGVQRSGEDAEQVVVEQPRAATPPKQKQPDQQPQQAEPQELQRRPRDPWLSAEGGGQRRKGWL